MSFLESLFSLEGKIAVLTYVILFCATDYMHCLILAINHTGSGGTRGIGQALAVALAKAGADIVLIQVS